MKLLAKLLIILVAFTSSLISQNKEDQLGTSLDPKKGKKIDHSSQVKSKMLYADKSKHIVYNYTMKEGNNNLSDGKIYRKFTDNGIYETFYITGNKESIRFAYFSDPTALITSNINKSEYCTFRDEFSVLYPFMMRGMVKSMKSKSLEQTFKKIKITLEKKGTEKSGNLTLTKYEVKTTPSIFSGEIYCHKNEMILKGSLTINNKNVYASGLKGFAFMPNVANATNVNFNFNYEYYDNNEPKPFYQIQIDEMIKHFEKVDCN